MRPVKNGKQIELRLVFPFCMSLSKKYVIQAGCGNLSKIDCRVCTKIERNCYSATCSTFTSMKKGVMSNSSKVIGQFSEKVVKAAEFLKIQPHSHFSKVENVEADQQSCLAIVGENMKDNVKEFLKKTSEERKEQVSRNIICSCIYSMFFQSIFTELDICNINANSIFADEKGKIKIYLFSSIRKILQGKETIDDYSKSFFMAPLLSLRNGNLHYQQKRLGEISLFLMNELFYQRNHDKLNENLSKMGIVSFVKKIISPIHAVSRSTIQILEKLSQMKINKEDVEKAQKHPQSKKLYKDWIAFT